MRITNLVCTILFLAYISGAVVADDLQSKPQEKPTEGTAEQGQLPAKPGPEHKHLQRLVGDWECEVHTFQPGQDEATKSAAKAKIISLLGGLFIQQNFQGEMEGVKFRGRGVTGYDQVQKKFVGTWIDSTNSSMMVTKGDYDVKTNTLTELGKMSGPTGEMTFKMVSKFESNNKFNMTMFMVQEGADVKFMRIDYTRKK